MDGVVNLTLAAGSTSHGDIVDLDGLNEDSSLDLRDPTGASISLPHGVTNFTVGAGATWSGVIRGINDTTVEDGGNAVSNGPATVTGNVATGTNSTVTYNSRSEEHTYELQSLMRISYADFCLTKKKTH